jgi:predicted TIM-barrel fold metal-dependent hydrolase
MPIDRIVTPAMRMLYDPDRPPGVGYPAATMDPQILDPAARVAWLDAQGIAVQNVISGHGYTLARAIRDPALGMAALDAVNTWITDRLSDHRDRLLPVATLRYDDLTWVTAEMARMRGRGSRAFLISSEPVNGIPHHHPDFDQVWSAAEDLGMAALLHVGLAPALHHPGWANTDDPALIRLISVIQPYQSAQVLLAMLVFGGVFERHPGLTVLISELGIDWFAPAVAWMDGMADSPLVVGGYKLPLRPSEYVRRNVRISPLPAAHQVPLALLEQLPECVVFSSDYPHFEGSDDPVAHYGTQLAGVEPARRDGFLAGNILDSYARMGDPLLG